MSEIVILTALLSALVVHYLYRRNQEPNHLTEIVNGLRLKSALANARGDTYQARDYTDMADAIREAQKLVNYQNSRPNENINLIFIRLHKVASQDVLNSLDIFNQNHRYDCYKAILNLSTKLEKSP